MAQVIGYVKSLQNGAFFAKDAHGEVRELKAGDQIFKDELVFGAQNNPQNAQVIIDVTLTDASDIVLSGVDQLYADISVIGGSFETEDAVVATDSLENAWKLSTNTTTPDTTTPLEATAAGIEAPAAGLTTADGDRPINGTFYDRTGLIGDVRTTLTQDTLNGGTSQTIARVDTQDYNEQPTVENVTGSVNEALNGLNQITGQLVASDPDAGDTHTFFAVDGSLLINGEPAPKGVVLVLNEDGTYSVTGDFNALAVGENAVITFQYYAVDNGLEIGETHTSLPATVTITVQGTNDSPVVTNASSALLGAVVEAGSNDDGSSVAGIATISGQLSASDVDNGATQKWSIVGTADTTYGTISINANTGKWTYTLNNTDTDTQALAEGESKTLNYTARVIDDKGAYVDQTITITISGTNDAPVLTSSTALSFSVAEDAAEADADKSYSGNIGIGSLATDVDHGAVLQIGKVNGVTVGIDGVDQMVTFTYIDKNGNPASFEASLHVNQDGIYTISTSNDLNPLPAGVNATASLNFTITDENGAQTAPKTVNLTITGDNDAPTTETIALKAIAEDSEALLITQADLLANANDVDNANLSATNLAISSGNGTLVDHGNGTWSYTPASNDDTSVSFSYTISDGDKTVAGSATLDITPVNDAPVTTRVTLAAIAEDSGARLITQAQLLANASDPVEHDSLVATDLAITSGKGSLVNNGDGTWTYTPASNDDTSVSFSYKITDNGTTNGVADPKTITGSATLDITPVNDLPDAIDDSYSYLGQNLIINGSFEDINGVNASGQTVSGVALGSLAGTSLVSMKSITGWSLTDSTMTPMEPHAGGHAGVGTTDGAHYMDLGASPGNSAISQTIGGLTGGSLYQFSVDYRDKAAMQESGADGKASGVMEILWNGVVVATVQGNNVDAWKTLTLNVTAVNGDNTLTFREIGVADDNWGIAIDNVQLKSINAALVTDEDTAFTITPATLLGNDTDVDGGALVLSSVQNATHGTVALVNGNVVFTPAKDYNGEATFTYTINDGKGGEDTAKVTLYVNPINDAPVIAGRFSDTVVEDGQQTATGTLTISDVDTQDNPISFVDQSATVGNNGYGSFSLVNGTWTYTLNNVSVQSLAERDTVTDKITFTATDGSTQEVSVTITGTNDTPVITNDLSALSGAVTEDALLTTASGQLSASDVDNGATQTWSIVGTPDTTYGSISIDSTGKWTYTLNNALSTTQALGVNDHVTQTYVARVTDDQGAYVDQTITVTINGAYDAPVVTAHANDDRIITNAGTDTFVVPEWALLANDTGTTDVTAVSNKLDLTTVTLNSDSITVRDDSNWPFDPDGGSFNYTADGSTAQVTITQKSVGDYILEGTNSDEIIISDNYGSYLKGKDGNDILIGGNAKDVLEGGNGNDTLTGENGSDELYGGSGNDTLIYDSSDDVINGGTGTDTLLFRENTSINFGALDSYNNPIENIEVFDLTKANVEMKNLSLQDVIDMTENTKDLYILGDTGDKVDFANSNGWSKSATPVIETVNGASHTFDVYTNAGDPSVVVKVEQNIHDTI